MYDYCKTCDNNCGGCCAYDLELEAKETGKTLEEIYNKDRCLYYDPRESE